MRCSVPLLQKGTTEGGSPTIRAWAETWRHRPSPTFTTPNPIVVPAWSSEILPSARLNALAQASPKNSFSPSSPEGTGMSTKSTRVRYLCNGIPGLAVFPSHPTGTIATDGYGVSSGLKRYADGENIYIRC